MELILGDNVSIMSGKVVYISEYPKLDLTYYGIEYYDFRRRLTEIVFIEKNKLQEKQNGN
jgi:hypothetical protein